MDKKILENLFDDIKKSDDKKEDIIEEKTEENDAHEDGKEQQDSTQLEEKNLPSQMTSSADSKVVEDVAPQVPQIPKEIQFMLNAIDKEINTVMKSCNNIDRESQKILKEAQIIKDDIYTLMAQKSETAILNLLIEILGKCVGVMISTMSYTQTIKSSQERVQQTIDMYKDRFKE